MIGLMQKWLIKGVCVFAPVQQGGVCISLRFQRREMLAPYLRRMRIMFVLKTAEGSITHEICGRCDRDRAVFNPAA
jgi:hypothetical protein